MSTRIENVRIAEAAISDLQAAVMRGQPVAARQAAERAMMALKSVGADDDLEEAAKHVEHVARIAQAGEAGQDHNAAMVAAVGDLRRAVMKCALRGGAR